MITQCSIRHLYTLASIPQSQKEALILRAKSMERRRCNHHLLEQPLSTLECLSTVIDPKGSHTNKNRYVVASQEEEVRRYCRGIRGVPLVYVKRSVMVMEPMAESSLSAREGFEKGKFRAGIRGKGTNIGQKRKRGDDESNEDENGDSRERKPTDEETQRDETLVKKKKVKGPKGPNPLSVKKAQRGKETVKSNTTPGTLQKDPQIGIMEEQSQPVADATNVVEAIEGQGNGQITKRKRKRKHKPSNLTELLQAEDINEGSS